MSFQSFPGQPGVPQQPYGTPQAEPAPTVQQPGTPFAAMATPPGGARRKGWLVGGLVLLLVGVGGGAFAFISSGSQVEDAVKELARAPVGCTTTLEFDKSGTFTVFVETKGSIGSVRGDCSSTDATYERSDSSLPDVTLIMVDDSGDEVSLNDDPGTSYDVSGFAGTSIGTVTIDAPGTFELTAASDEDDYAIAVGKDPGSAEGSLKAIGVAAIIAGVVLGGGMLILGLRRKPAAQEGPTGGPVAGPPQQWGGQQQWAAQPPPPAAPSGESVMQPPSLPQPTYSPPPTPPGPAPMAPGGWPQPPQG